MVTSSISPASSTTLTRAIYCKRTEAEAVMAMNQVQFQRGLSMAEFMRRYCAPRQCEQALEAAR
jgi:hypothetical protein